MKMLRNFLNIMRGWGRGSSPTAVSPIPLSFSDEFTIANLWNDFERRTSHYEYLKSSLEYSNPRLLNWIGSIDYSGHIREGCLRWLMAHFEPGDENRILLRLSDWVPQVRGIAQQWVLSNFQALPISVVQSNQRLFLFLSRKERIRNETAWSEITDVLLHHAESMTKRDYFLFEPMFRRLLFQLSLVGSQALRPWLLNDPEPFNRLLTLSNSKNVPTPREHLRLMQDKSVFVRLRYFHWRLRQKILPAEDELIALALDKKRSLRDIGRFYLQKFYGIDAYELYRHRDGDDFYFIADYRRPEDIDHFIQGLSSQNRKVTEICLNAIAATEPSRLKDLDLVPLIKGNRHTRKIVCRCMPRLFNVSEFIRFRDAFENSSHDYPITYLAVLEQISFWAFLASALDYLISGSSPAVVSFISSTVSKKTQIFETLPQETRIIIEDKLKRLKQRPANYPKNDLELLEFIARRA